MSISVVVPSYNSATFLREALESALSQEPGPLEVIVQDGGSTDDTAEVIAAVGDPRITFISEPDAGQSDALNKGIARAHGDWIGWLNADDLYLPGLFAAASDDADLVYGAFDYIDASGEVLRHVTPPWDLTRNRLLADGCFFFSGAALFRRSLFERFGDIDTSYRYAMDYELYLRFAEDVRAKYVPKTLGAFRVHGESLTTDISWGLVRETARARRAYGGYSRATRRAVLWNQAKQVVDAATVPVRRRLRRG
jgi:glycosyltransferase involved in cell wall biosynthesis